MRIKDKQKAKIIESYINEFYKDHYRPPSLREIESQTGISRQTVHRYLNEMNINGELKYDAGGVITKYIESISLNSLSVLGDISCGAPQMEQEWQEEQINVFLGDLDVGSYYLLRAKGDSMINAGIYEDDYVLVQKTNVAEYGQIVVAMNEFGENTLKRLVYDKKLNRPVLHPENLKYLDVVPKEIHIQGVAKKIIKHID